MMNIRIIEDKVFERVKLSDHERNFLIDDIFKTKLKDDDPKYDDWNSEWLENETDERLIDLWRESNG